MCFSFTYLVNTPGRGGWALWITSPTPEPSGTLNHLGWTFQNPPTLNPWHQESELITEHFRSSGQLWSRQHELSPFPARSESCLRFPKGMCVHRLVGEKASAGLRCLRRRHRTMNEPSREAQASREDSWNSIDTCTTRRDGCQCSPSLLGESGGLLLLWRGPTVAKTVGRISHLVARRPV